MLIWAKCMDPHRAKNSCKESMRQTEKQQVSAGEIEETIQRKRRKESQSTIHRVKMGRMSRSEAILSHNAKEKEELEKKKTACHSC